MGDFRLIRGPDIVIDTQSATEDILIPRVKDEDKVDISRIRWVLIIEKEVRGAQKQCLQPDSQFHYLQAVFHRLARISYHTRALAGEGLMVTVSCILQISCLHISFKELADITSPG